MQQQPLPNQPFAAQPLYYSNPSSHGQMMHRTLTNFHPEAHITRQHHSPVHSHYRQRHLPMRSECQYPVAASLHSEYSSPWQQSVNHAGDIATASCTNPYSDFANHRQAVMATHRQRAGGNVQLTWQLSSGFGTPTNMQHGNVGGQHPQSGAQNHRSVQDYETNNMLDMNQSVSTGADSQQIMYTMYQQPRMAVDHRQIGRRPREFVAPAQHSVSASHQPINDTDSFTSYQSACVIPPSESFAVQKQVTWNNCQSYTQTGCCTFLSHSILCLILESL